MTQFLILSNNVLALLNLAAILFTWSRQFKNLLFLTTRLFTEFDRYKLFPLIFIFILSGSTFLGDWKTTGSVFSALSKICSFEDWKFGNIRWNLVSALISIFWIWCESSFSLFRLEILFLRKLCAETQNCFFNFLWLSLEIPLVGNCSPKIKIFCLW